MKDGFVGQADGILSPSEEEALIKEQFKRTQIDVR
jgi:hypothetical protein